MRLINAEALLEEMKSDKWCEDYLGESVAEGIYDYVKQAPTAFDLESVIKQLNENKEDILKAIDENTPSGFYAVSTKDLKAMFEDYTKEQIDILKSATNVTNGKNGG